MDKEYPISLFKHGEERKCENSGQEAHARAQGFTEPYKFAEYPKHLYKDGTREVHEVTGEQIEKRDKHGRVLLGEVVVKNLEEETAARAKGFRLLGEPEEKADPKKAEKKAA